MSIRELPGYELTQVISETPTLSIWRGIRLSDDKPVVIKQRQYKLKPTSNTCTIEHEFKLGKRVDSSGITNYFDFLNESDGSLLIREDFGEFSLKQLSAVQTVGIRAFISIAVQLAQALVDIHQQGIVHNFLSPEHVLLKQIDDDDWQLKVTDFRLASHADEGTPPSLEPEQLKKALPYVSPEQTGRMNRSVDYRSDLYVAGVLLYLLACKRPPFDSEDPQDLIHSHMARMPISLDELRADFPPIVCSMVMKLLNKSPEERYKSAYGLLVDLQKCQQQLLDNDAIRFFHIGEKDVFEKFHIPDTIYGRSKELDVLIDSYKRCEGGGCELVTLSGGAGVGKSALVSEFEKQLHGDACTIAKGKFDQLAKGIAYSAVSQAFQGLVYELLAESEAKLGRWRQKFLAAWGHNGRLITDMIPNLVHIVDQQDPVEKLEPQEAKTRLQSVFRQFVRVFASNGQPMILFLDDLQWADMGSLNLVENILLDKSSSNLLVIGAYRDNEVGPHHPASTMIDDIKQHNVNHSHIDLAPIRQQDVNHLLVDALSSHEERVEDLAALVFKKTLGNAFFVRQFLKSLADESLLSFDSVEHQWQWDTNRILERNVTDNVVTLMTDKIAKFTLTTQKAMQLAAVLGASFDAEVLGIISCKTKQEVLYELAEPINEGLLLSDNIGLRFLHDRVQESAYEMIEPSERKAIHLNVARILLAEVSQQDFQENVFEIAGHFIKGIDLLSDEGEKQQVAELLLQASDKAINASAFESSLQYASIAIRQLLTEDSWKTDYELTWRLYRNKGYCEYTTLELEDSEKTLILCLDRSQTQDHKVSIYAIYSRLLFQMNKHHEGIQNTREALAYLGIKVPKKITTWHVAWLVVRVRFAMGLLRRPEQLLQMAETSDPLVLNISRVLYDSVESSYMVDANTMAYFSLLITQLCVKNGNSMYAPFAYGMLSLVLAGKTREFSLADRFAKMGLGLNNKRPDKGVRGRVNMLAANFTHHWMNPIKTHLKLVKVATQCCVDTGSLHWANYSIVFSRPQSILFSTHDLEKVIAENEHAYDFHFEYQDREVILQQSYLLDFCHWLSATKRDVDNKRPVFDSVMYAREMSHQGNFLIRTYYHFFQMFRAYLQDDLELALKHGEVGVKYAPETIGNLIELPVRFLYLICLLQHKGALLSGWRRLNLAYQQPRLLVKRIAKNNPNEFMAMELMLQAEEARVDGRNSAVELYDQAIEVANTTGYQFLSSIANELTAKYYLLQHRRTIALAYMTSAYKVYLSWGAFAKTSLMEQMYPDWFTHAVGSPENLPPSETSWQNELDVMALIKAAQVISNELNLNHLLAKLLHIIIENSGAEEGCLALGRNGTLQIVAQEYEGVINDETQSISLDESEHVCEGIMRAVYRSGTPIALDDASNVGKFVDDVYITSKKVKSVLCLPLLSHDKVIGVVYLENNLASSVFTESHIVVANLLLSQASISLKHAELFDKQTQTELELTKSQKWLRTLIDTVPSMIYVKNIEGRFLEVNQAVADSFGMTIKDVIGRLHSDLHVDQEEVNAMLYIDKQVIQSGKESHVEQQRYTFRDGSKRWMQTIKVPCPENVFGEACIVGINIDITDLKSAANELHQLRNYLSSVVNSMPSILIGVDVDGKVTQWNKGAEDYTNISYVDALGQLLINVFPQLTRELDRVKTAIDTQQTLQDKKVVRFHEGHTIYQDITVYPLVDERIRGAVIRIDDVTEQVKMEEMIVQSEKMLSVGGLAAGMAHEINNPLAGMIQSSNVMKNRLTDDALPANKDAAEQVGTSMEAIHEFMDNRGILRMLDSINDAGGRVADIVDNMLSFARKSDADTGSYDINDLLDKAIHLAATDYDLKNDYDFKVIEITRDYGKDLPLLSCEPSKIQQVFLNILRNGAQAMQGAALEQQLFIISSKFDEASKRMIIAIQDNGPGMDEATSKRIFEPFFTTKTIGSGTGLGLSVSYFIITENHHGEMTVESELGEGTRFVIQLPVES